MRKLIILLLFAFAAGNTSCNQTKYDRHGKPITIGRYRLRTFPKGAKVWVNGKLEVLHTPATLVLEAGTYHLKIQVPGAESVERTVTIGAGEAKELNMRVPAPPPATITVRSDVIGADVRINGYRRGATPLIKAQTKPGHIDITVTTFDGRALSQSTQLAVAEQKELMVDFSKVRTATPALASLPGKLTLGMQPKGSVYLADGKTKLGDAPLVEITMEAGDHTLILRSKDGLRERKLKITVKPNEVSVYRIRLRPSDKAPGAPDPVTGRP